MKLTIKEVLPYLPYGLEFICICPESMEYEISQVSNIHFGNELIEVGATDYEFSDLGGEELKPILKPLSEIIGIEEICDEFSDHEWDKFQFAFMTNLYIENKFDYLSYSQAELMFKHRIDIFGLIENNLAIDENTVDI